MMLYGDWGEGEGGALDNCCQWIIPFVIVIILRSEAAHREINIIQHLRIQIQFNSLVF